MENELPGIWSKLLGQDTRQSEREKGGVAKQRFGLHLSVRGSMKCGLKEEDGCCFIGFDWHFFLIAPFAF